MSVASVDYRTSTDWGRFTVLPISTPNNVQTLTVSGGEGLVEGGATGDGNDRRVFMLNDFAASDLEARVDFRLLHDGTGPAQIGFHINRDGLPIVVWTNIFFAADARLLLGAWDYDGNTLISTHQEAYTNDIEAQTFADPNRVRALKVQVEGDRLRIKQWYTDTPQPGWSYDGVYPAFAGGEGTNPIGLIIAHTGAGKSNIVVLDLKAIGLDRDAEWFSTDAFIRDNPFDVVLSRFTRMDTPAGGTKKVPLGTLPPQLARLVESGLQGSSATRHLPDGRVVNVQATLVLHVGADVEAGDIFYYNGQDWECGQVGGRWATRVEVWRYAEV